MSPSGEDPGPDRNSDPDAVEIPKGSFAAGRRVRLPQGAAEPIVVYLNGVAQTAGEDYDVEGSEIVFTRDIIKEEIGMSRWLAMYLGFFGTYRKDETIDVQFSRDGKTELASDVEVHQ
jgi:hypothetical protein